MFVRVEKRLKYHDLLLISDDAFEPSFHDP